MIDQGELEQILDKYLYQFDGEVCGVPAAAKAIAARLTPTAMMSEFVGLVHSGNTQSYRVPHTDGTRRTVWLKTDGVTLCWDPDAWDPSTDPPIETCSDSRLDTTCDHVQAVKLYLAREEQSTNV